MKLKKLTLTCEFDVAFTVGPVQGAQMTLAVGEHTGGPENRHAAADQWLFVVSGTGIARVDNAQHELEPGSLLVIEHGEAHEIRATGDQPLRTVNFYSPPAYDANGVRLPAGEN